MKGLEVQTQFSATCSETNTVTCRLRMAIRLKGALGSDFHSCLFLQCHHGMRSMQAATWLQSQVFHLPFTLNSVYHNLCRFFVEFWSPICRLRPLLDHDMEALFETRTWIRYIALKSKKNEWNIDKDLRICLIRSYVSPEHMGPLYMCQTSWCK
jgi:hypothetical protein